MTGQSSVWTRLAWMVAIWTISVLSLGLVAGMLRWILAP